MSKLNIFLKEQSITICGSLVFLDQIIKHNIGYQVLNFGASFGILQNTRWFLASVSIIAMIFIGYLFYKNKEESLILPYSLIFFGAMSNLIDRLFLGYVIDYIPSPFFTFNIADSMITIGISLLIILEIIKYKKTK